MNPGHIRTAIERTGIEKPSDYTLVMEEVGRMEDATPARQSTRERRMSDIPEDVMKAARDASLLCIGGMCSTYRHDYGLLPENERKALYVTMSQLAYHDVAPVIARAIMAERERCADAARNAEGPEEAFRAIMMESGE